MAISQTDLNKIYLAYFGRPVDASGLATFSKMEIGNVIGAFDSSKESQDLYGTDPVAKINAIYKNLFGREAEPEGLKGWLDRLATGEVTPASAALEILNRAQNSDAKAIENKIAAADAFTTELLKNTGSMVGYSGNDAAKVARDWLAKVNAESKIDEVVKGVNAAVVAVSSAGGTSVTGNTFTLTDKIGESVVGTTGNDTFKAVFKTGAATDSTLNLADSIDGGAGTDTLNLLFAGAASTDAPASGVTIKNVEIINLDLTAAASGVAASNGAAAPFFKSSAYEGVTQLWQVDSGNNGSASAKIGNVTVGEGVVAGFRGNGKVEGSAADATAGAADATATVTAASAAQKALSVALDGIGSSSKITFAGATGGKIETVTISGSVAGETASATGKLAIDAAGNALTVNGAFTSDVNIGASISGANLKTIDLSKSTGGVTINASGLAKLETIKGGAGADKVSITVNAAGSNNGNLTTIDLGAGNDTLIFASAATGNKELSVTLGAGKDTLEVGSLANVQDTADLAKGLVTVADFKIGEDTINLKGKGVALTSAQLDSAKGAGSLKAAAEVAIAATDAVASKTMAVFSYGGDAYVVIDNGTDGTLDVGDALIKLVGVDATLLSTDQNGGLIL